MAGGTSLLLGNFTCGSQLCFIEGLSAGSITQLMESSGWILRFYAGHSDFMVILLLNQMRSKGSVSKGRSNTMVLSRIWGWLGGHGIPGSKLNVSENNGKERKNI